MSNYQVNLDLLKPLYIDFMQNLHPLYNLTHLHP